MANKLQLQKRISWIQLDKTQILIRVYAKEIPAIDVAFGESITQNSKFNHTRRPTKCSSVKLNLIFHNVFYLSLFRTRGLIIITMHRTNNIRHKV